MNGMRKTCVCACAVMAALTLCARPGHYGRGYRHYHHHHRHAETGFAIGAGILGAGLLASAIYDATRPAPPPPPVVVAPTPVVTQPVVAQQPVAVNTGHYETRTQTVWVEGRYVDQPNGAGQMVRVWQPGHYEEQQTRVWVQ
ncbi:MAG: hypothetical protein ACI4RA_02275 [Kiritimatiellia bacterium]